MILAESRGLIAERLLPGSIPKRPMSLLLKKFLMIGAASLLGSANPSRVVLWSCDRIAESRAQYALETHNGREKLVSLFDKESASRWSFISGINFLGFPLAGGGTRQVASFSQPVISPQLPSAEGAQKESNDRTSSEATATKHPSRWQWSLLLRNRTGFRLDGPRVFQMSRIFFEAKGIYKFNPKWGLTLEGRAHYDPVGRLGYPKKLWFDPRQFLLDGKINNVNVSLGLQQTVWGQADGLRVLDVINPLDYREFILEDFLDSRRPLWALRTDIPIQRGSLQLIWIPYFAPGRLPVGDNEMALGASFGLGLINAASGSLSLSSATLAPAWRPGYRLSSSQVGLGYRRSLGRWDLTANYFNGWEDVPTPYLDGFDRRSPPLPLRPIVAPQFDRKEIFGGTAATNLNSVVLRLEAGWNSRKATPVVASSNNGFEKLGQFSSVVGLDHSPRPWLWLSGQYFLQLISASQRSLLFPRYNQLASIYVRTNFFRDTLKPELFVLTGLNQRQYLVRPRLVKTFGDHWSVGLGADWMGGRPINPFGFLSSRDRAVVELKWTD